LRNLVFLVFGEGIVQLQGAIAFSATGGIIVRVPVTSRYPDAAVYFFD
jgi:hypothetical protein